MNHHHTQTPLFHELLKHKIFDLFPSLEPIVSGFNSCKCNLSKFVVCFLKFQVQKCKFYIMDTKDLITKLLSIKNVPENSFLAIRDVSSPYAKIDYEEDAEASFKKIDERKIKSGSSIVIKNLILMILKLNTFRFDNEYYRQMTGTAMMTPMAANYANLFLDNFK